MISYNAIVSEIPMFKFKNSNGESVDVVSGRFVERYFNKVEGDSKIKTVYKRNGLYKEGIDYFVNYDINCYDKFNFFSIKRNDLYDVVFTKSGVNKYMNKLRDKELFESRIERINGNFEVKTKIKHKKIKGTSVPQITLYIEKAAVEYILMDLYEQSMLTKSQTLFLIRKIVSKQISVESCA